MPSTSREIEPGVHARTLSAVHRVRPFAERDYPAYARLRTRGAAPQLSVDEVREEDRRWDWSRFDKLRLVAVDDDDASVGYGEIYQSPSRFDPRRYFVDLVVDAPVRRRGVGAAIWHRLHAALVERSALVACRWADDHTSCSEFMTKHGFREVIRAYGQVLTIATAPLPAPGIEEQLSAAGIRIATLPELVRERPDAMDRAHELYSACRVDQPTLGRVTEWPFADWHAFNVEDPLALPDAYFIALAGERFVGNCSVRRTAGTADVLTIGITGVLPEFRRRGIARALKLRTHAYARLHGYNEIRTSNTGPNVGMLALNKALGYIFVDSWAGYELDIAAAT